MVRAYRHAVTGRGMTVLEGTRLFRLVEADDNWVDVTPAKEASSDGSSGTGGRRSTPRKGANSGRGGKRSKPAG